MTESYRVPLRGARAQLREKGSRFLAALAPASDEVGARAVLEGLGREHADATHHCWAWRLGSPPRERAHDAGEPSGTAGIPILKVLQGEGLSDLIVVVIRWYGGTDLGKGGLARAYAAVARMAVEAAPIGRRILRDRFRLRLSYPDLGALRRIERPPEIEILSGEYGSDVEVVLAVAPSRRSLLEEMAARRGLELEHLEQAGQEE